MQLRLVTVLLALVSCAASTADCDQVWRGIYVHGAEVETLRPCGSDTTYWVDYGFAGLPLKEFHLQHTSEPYEAIYVEFRGHLLYEETDGFAASYDGLIRVSEVLELSSKIPPDCHTG